MLKRRLTAKITRQQLEAFVAQHATDQHTLDIGCAHAPYARYFPNRVGFDITPGEGVDVVGDAHKLPFGDREFAVVVCTEVLEHLHTPHRAIAEMFRVLKPEGTLILTTRFVFPMHDTPHDFYRYTKYGLKHLFKDWKIVELREEVSTQNTFAVLLQRLGYHTELRGGVFARGLIFLLARALVWLPSLITKEYGVRKGGFVREESSIMTTGYYLVAKRGKYYLSQITTGARMGGADTLWTFQRHLESRVTT